MMTAAQPAPRHQPQHVDPIVAAYTADDVGVVDRLRACQVAIAIEHARLQWLEENPDAVDDLLEAGRAISRRVRAIKKIVELELDVQRLRGDPEPDIRSPIAKKVYAALVDQLEEVTRDMVAEDTANNIFNLFKAKVEAHPDIPWP
jgi:hypothetical protein